jgi:hypothetical protein
MGHFSVTILTSTGSVVSDIQQSCIITCLDWSPTNMEERSDIDLAMSGDAGLNQITSREVGEVLARTLLPKLDHQTPINGDIKSRLIASESY